MVKKICPKCGAQGNSTAKFCSKCGSMLLEKTVEETNGGTNRNTNRSTNESSFDKFLYFLGNFWRRGFDGREEEAWQARKVSSPQPLPNEMRRLKSIYPILLVCFGLGLFADVFLAIAIIGFIVLYFVDICMTEYRMYHLRKIKFWANQDMTNESVFDRIQPVMLSKYGIYVNKDENGQAVIEINDFYYTIILNSDSTFFIRWEATFKRNASIRLLRDVVYYKYYKEMLGALGTIAYEIQSQFGIVSNMNSEQNTYSQKGMGAQTQGFTNQSRQNQNGSMQGDSAQKAQGNWRGHSYNFAWSPLTNRKTNWIAVVSSSLMILCIFLPYARTTVFGVTTSVTLIEGDGWFFLGVAIIALILGLMGKNTGVLIMSILAVILTVVEVISFSDFANEETFGYLIERGSGYYLMIISTIGLVVGALYEKFIFQEN